MSLYLDTIAVLQAALPTAPTMPVGDLGFGTDLRCGDDLDFSEIVSDDPRVVSYAAVRWLLTNKGSLIDAPDWGFGLHRFLRAPFRVSMCKAIQDQIRSELIEVDDRIDSCEVSVTYDAATSRLSASIKGILANKSPFGFTAVVSPTETFARVIA